MKLAWRGGARFDGWSEYFRARRLATAAAQELGIELGGGDLAAAARRPGTPWWTRASTAGFFARRAGTRPRGEPTDDCRDGACAACGVCGGGIEMELLAMTFWLVTFSAQRPGPLPLAPGHGARVQRTFARAAVPIALSQGMRPKPRLSLPLPLPVGAAGREELAVVEVAAGGPAPAAALRALRAAASPGLEPSAITVVEQGHPRPQPTDAEYACVVDGDTDALLAAVVRYGREERVQHERVSPKGRRTFDFKEYVGDAAAEPVAGGALVRFTVHHRTDGAARPQEFVGLIARWAGTDPAMRRLERRRIRWQTSPADLERAGRSVTP